MLVEKVAFLSLLSRATGVSQVGSLSQLSSVSLLKSGVIEENMVPPVVLIVAPATSMTHLTVSSEAI